MPPDAQGQQEQNDFEIEIQPKLNEEPSTPPLGEEALACAKITLEWKEISVKKKISVGRWRKKTTIEKDLLKGISGIAKAGELMAIMGPSGGGKTTLLNVLSRRAKFTSGAVTINGRKLPKNFNRISAYVMQDDLLFEVLTPRELFQFSANLRLPRDMSKKKKKEMVSRVIKTLMMEGCADTRIGGNLLRGVSGGERKRASIGYELITNPSLLFLDEPTSGLDSSTSLFLVQTLRKLAQQGHTVICTIHQPSSEIFKNFDVLTLLVSGEEAYFGKGEGAIGFFAEQGFPCPNYTNPADYFMDLLQIQSEEDRERTNRFVSASRSQGPEIHQEEDDGKEERIIPPKRPFFYTQLWELTLRGWRINFRNPIAVRARIAQTIIIAVLVMIVYWRLGYYQVDIRDRSGVMFFVITTQIMTSLNSVLLTFPLERALLIREQANGMYNIVYYFIGRFVSGLPFDLFLPTLFVLLIYWSVNLNHGADHFFLLLLALIAMSLASSSLGLLLGCMLPNAETAVSLAPVVIIPFILFAGFYVNIESIPSWIRWVQYISIFKWGFQAALTNEFTGTQFSCQPNELIGGACPITSGDEYLATFNFEFVLDYWIAVVVLFGLFLFFRVLSLGFLIFQTRKALKSG